MHLHDPRARAAALSAASSSILVLGCPSERTSSSTSTARPETSPSATASIVHQPGIMPPARPARSASSAQPSEPAPPKLARLTAEAARKTDSDPRGARFVGRDETVAIVNGRGVDLIDAVKTTGLSFVTSAAVQAYAMTGDGALVAVADSARTTLWDTRRGALLHTFPLAAQSLVFSSDGKRLAAGGDTLVVWDTATFAEAMRRADTNVFVAAFAAGDRVVASSNNVDVSVYDLESGAKLSEGSAQTGATFGIDLSPDGRWAAAAAPDGHGMQVFDVQAWRPRQLVTITSCEEHVGVRFSRDGRFVFAHGGPRWVKGFEAGTWKPYASYHAVVGRAVDSAADDLSRVTVTRDGRAPVVVTVQTKAEVKLDSPFEEATRYELSASGLFVAAALNGSARVWSAKTGRVVYEVRSQGR